jgi:hypothetical protein
MDKHRTSPVRRALRAAALASLALHLPHALAQVGKAAESKGPLMVAGDTLGDLGPRKPAKPAPPSTFPRLANKRPDFTGIWFAGVKDLVLLDDSKVDVPLTPEYQAVRQQRVKATSEGHPPPDYVSTCQAFGMPRLMSYGTFEFVARPDRIWVISEVLHEVRRIYLDGKTHGADQEPSFGGVAHGRWDGDTLVVETTKLRAGYMNMTGIPHSDQMRIVERIRMVNKDAIENEMTITDPVALTRPWVVMQRYDRQPAGFDIAEYNCMENYRSGGGATVDPASDPGKMLPPSATSQP